MKSLRAWLRERRRWAVGAGVVALLAVALITAWYRQYPAENPAREPIAARDVPRQEKLETRPEPSSNVADRPTRDRGPRP